MSRAPELHELLARLRADGVVLHRDAEGVRAEGRTDALDDAALAELRGRRAEIESLLDGLGAVSSDDARVVQEYVRAGARLSSGHERIWLLHQTVRDTAVANVVRAYDFEGPLDPARLRAAVECVAERHAVLALRFETDDGAPRAHWDAGPRVDFEVVDLRSGSERVARWVDEIACEPIALDGGPQVRMRLLQHGAERFVLVVSASHIAWDGESWRVFASELSAAYAGIALAPTESLAVDDGARHARWRQSPAAERARAYWRAALQDVPATTVLPTKDPQEAGGDRGRFERFVIDAEVEARVEALARREAATPMAVALSVLAVVLARYAGQTRIVIGVPCAGRDGRHADAIGMFSNTLPIVVDLADDPCLAALTRRTARAVVEGLAHQALPIDEIEALRRSESSRPSFRVMLGWHPEPPVPQLPGIDATLRPLREVSTAFDLALVVEQGEGRRVWSWLRRSERYDDAVAKGLADAFSNVLAAATALPERPLSGIGLRPDADWVVEPADERTIEGAAPATVVEAPADRFAIVDEHGHRAAIGGLGRLCRRADNHGPWRACGWWGRRIDDGHIRISGRWDRRRIVEGVPVATDATDADPPKPVASERPATRLDREVLALCRDVLADATLGPDDDLFERGAQSLSLVRLSMRIQRHFAVSLEVGALFDRPTVEGLVDLVSAAAERALVDAGHAALIEGVSTMSETRMRAQLAEMGWA